MNSLMKSQIPAHYIFVPKNQSTAQAEHAARSSTGTVQEEATPLHTDSHLKTHR